MWENKRVKSDCKTARLVNSWERWASRKGSKENKKDW